MAATHHTSALNLEPACETITLANGATFSLITFCDGTYRVMYDHAGTSVQIPLSAQDVRGVRMLTGDVILTHLHAIADEVTR